MFDTIIFPRPVTCHICGELHEKTQTKLFENFMINYEIGDVLPGSVMTGVIEEDIYCEHKPLNGKEKPSWDKKIYIAIWHHILIDIVENYEEAENKIIHFGIGDLYLLYKSVHNSRNNFRGKCNSIQSWCNSYAEYLLLTPEEQQKVREGDESLTYFSYYRIKPYLDKDSPLKEFLKTIDKQKDFKFDLFI